MHNTYISSTIGFIRTKGSVCSSNNDYYNYYLLNERIEKIQSLPCICSSICIHGILINPRFLYGLRQSNFIQCSAYKRLSLGVGNRCFRLPAYNVKRVCYSDSYSSIYSSSSDGGNSRRRRKRGIREEARVGSTNWDEKNESCDLGEEGTAEAMLSLLTEEVGEKFIRSGVRVEKRGRGVSEYSRKEDKGHDSRGREMGGNKFESSTVKSREEVKGASSSCENYGLRKGGSSCSSYYSAFSSDDLKEVDTESQNKDRRTFAESVNISKESKQFSNYEGDDRDYGEVSREGYAFGELGVEANGVGQGSRNELRQKITSKSRNGPSQRVSNVLDIHESAHERTSDSQKRVSCKESNSTSSMNLREKTRNQSHQTGNHVIQLSDIQGSNIERASNSQNLVSQREDILTASANVVQEARKRHSQRGQQTNEPTTREVEPTRISAAQYGDKERNATSQSYSTSNPSSFQEVKERHPETYKQIVGNESSNAKASASSQEFYETRMNVRDSTSASVMDFAHESRQKHDYTTEQLIRQAGSKKESQGPIKVSSFRERSTKPISSSQTSFNPIQQDSDKEMDMRKEYGSNLQVTVTPPPSQIVARGSSQAVQYNKPTGGYANQELSGETSESSLDASHSAEAPHEVDSGNRHEDNGEHSEVIFHDDAMGSVSRLEQSSTQFVGEFKERLKHEVSTSELRERISTETTSSYKEETSTKQGSSQQVSDDFQSQVHGTKSSLSKSGRKGPSDEMWDVSGPSSHDPFRIEAPEEAITTSEEVTATSESAIVKRSSRTMWSVIADLVRMRWVARPEAHNSSLTSRGKSLSNESVGSEAWFSGQEADGKDDDNIKKDRREILEKPISADQPILGKVQTRKKNEASEDASSYEKITVVDAEISSSHGALGGDLGSKGAFSEYSEETYVYREDKKSGQGIPSSILKADSTLRIPSRRLLRSPPVIEEISEIRESELSTSGSGNMAGQHIIEGPNKVLEAEGKAGELKQRKVQRSNQVIKESFEEWEEAYRIESEQRKVDEIFMREALLEAKKAANTWEVPVGAVLVQRGKIIARGCNLVEQLRDSTAHAEMICIREASTLLRTWRLAETTLYVTLEPCAMCAGAILQARVDTVVWGAPNKLLGADGSWVRLFPGGGEEGSGSSDLTNHGPGPVHPFHPKITIRRGILATECADVMQQFFQLRRKKESPPPSCLPISANPTKLLSKMHNIFSFMFCL
ncbi:hypothetical protein GIB67_038503 [Kingdonia uniflora]|uniref:tRNA(adenine(34)) deaminase n=1 Tax=Kingdonia uniflora TaxID=39325 RepID=A0A7J7NPB3_9MAGN|nr:hypothetical protein GIB67_038503 [Kingdonia uniflora]